MTLPMLLLVAFNTHAAGSTQPRAGSRCELTVETAWSPRSDGGGTQVWLPPGSQITIVKAGRGFTRIKLPSGKQGYIAHAALSHCERIRSDAAGAQQWTRRNDDNAAGNGRGNTGDPRHLSWDEVTQRLGYRHALAFRVTRLSIPKAIMATWLDDATEVSGTRFEGHYQLALGARARLVVGAGFGRMQSPKPPAKARRHHVDVAVGGVHGGMAYEVPLPGHVSMLCAATAGVAWHDGDVTTVDTSAGEAAPATSKRQVSQVVPVLGLHVSPRMVLWDRLIVQMDMGLRNGFYWGAGLGWRL